MAPAKCGPAWPGLGPIDDFGGRRALVSRRGRNRRLLRIGATRGMAHEVAPGPRVLPRRARAACDGRARADCARRRAHGGAGRSVADAGSRGLTVGADPRAPNCAQRTATVRGASDDWARRQCAVPGTRLVEQQPDGAAMLASGRTRCHVTPALLERPRVAQQPQVRAPADTRRDRGSLKSRVARWRPTGVDTQ